MATRSTVHRHRRGLVAALLLLGIIGQAALALAQRRSRDPSFIGVLTHNAGRSRDAWRLAETYHPPRRQRLNPPGRVNDISDLDLILVQEGALRSKTIYEAARDLSDKYWVHSGDDGAAILYQSTRLQLGRHHQLSLRRGFGLGPRPGAQLAEFRVRDFVHDLGGQRVAVVNLQLSKFARRRAREGEVAAIADQIDAFWPELPEILVVGGSTNEFHLVPFGLQETRIRALLAPLLERFGLTDSFAIPPLPSYTFFPAPRADQPQPSWLKREVQETLTQILPRQRVDVLLGRGEGTLRSQRGRHAVVSRHHELMIDIFAKE